MADGVMADNVIVDGVSELPGLSGLVAWIEAETGLCFPEVHHDTIGRAASRRCAELSIGPEEYARLLAQDAGERSSFLSGVMIGETYFFRDERQFSILANTVLPKLMMERERVLMWSATCASGEEALSLAAVAEHVKATLGLACDYRVYASDINAEALSRLRTGRYSASSFRSDGKRWHGLLERLGSMDGDQWQANESAMARLEAKHLNLFTGELPAKESLDVVFFRNTLVYMKQDKKETIVDRIVATIRPGGCLFLASPEVPSVRHPLLESVEREGGFYFERLEKPRKTIHAAAPTRALGFLGGGGGQKNAARAKTPSARPSWLDEGRRQSAQRQASGAELDQALELASAWARGEAPAEDKHSERVRGFARALESVLKAIEANRFSAALELVDTFESSALENHVSLYLRALVLKHRGERAQALELWEKARLYCGSFWPALFQAGMAHGAGNPERSTALMSECLSAMDADASGGRFFALLEGFDSAYYRHMAHGVIAGHNRMKS